MEASHSLYSKNVRSTPFSIVKSGSLDYYESIFKNISDLIGVLGFDGYLKSVNPSFRRTLLWGENDLLQTKAIEFIHPDDLSIVKQEISKINGSKRALSFKARLRTKKNEYVLLHWSFKVDYKNALIYATGQNLTPLEKAKSELQLAKTMLEETNRIALVGGWQLENKTKEITWSSTTREIHEVDEDYKVTLENAISFFPEGQNRNKIEELVSSALNDNIPYETELEIITLKGRRKWVRVKGEPVFEGNECIKLIGTIQDISREKESEFNLRRVNSHLQAIMEASTEAAIIALDSTGTIMFFNSGAEMLLGYTANEMVAQKKPLDFIDPQTLIDKANRLSQKYGQKVQPDIDCLTFLSKKGIVDTQEYTFISRDNSRMEVEVSITPIKNSHDNIIGYVSIGLDVTEKKERERRIIDSENQFRIFFNSSHVVLYTHDLEGKFLSMNSRGTNLLGYTEEEIINKNILEIVPLESKKSLPEYLNEIIENGKSKGLMQIVDKNDNKITWMYHNVLAEYADGTKYVIGNVVDITDRIELENDLQEAKRTAEKNAQMKNLFLANMSHEIRTPMNAITGFGRLLHESPNLSEEQKDYVESINIASSNLLTLINDILDFSKIESGQLELESIQFKLQDQINYVRKILTPAAEKKGLRFKCMVDFTIPEVVQGDPTRLNQVLVNLINNAIKFTEEGYIQLSVQAIKNEDGINLIEFEVKDTGIGIPEDKKEAIFDRFTQANTNTTRKYGGTGLGLSISKSLIEMQGGQIEIESTVGKGSVFRFSLPFIAPSVIQLEDEKTENQEIELNCKNQILLVEDNVLNQKLAVKVLTNKGFVVDLAENGLVALEKLQSKSYDLILMDLQMPEMDGYQTAHALRNELQINTPVMAMTAHSLVGEKEKCLKFGMNDYITKPFDPKVLFRKIKELTEREIPEKEEVIAEKLDLSYLYSLSNRDKDFEKEILETSLITIPEDMNKLQDAIQNFEYNEIKAIAHKLKSSFMTIGMDANEELHQLEYEDIAEYKILEEIYYSVKEKYARSRKAVMAELEINY
ncbi:PAS domain S-box protein [Jiulongibacter sediminis]|uniref:PAS domain S-box protein n=1 Tax=Jiulongibacter sediminis TaxID=1605367 RepID=UPI0026EB1D53|nr:PAS domain S-box protein [Jiulongibacter sediminis]